MSSTRPWMGCVSNSSTRTPILASRTTGVPQHWRCTRVRIASAKEGRRSGSFDEHQAGATRFTRITMLRGVLARAKTACRSAWSAAKRISRGMTSASGTPPRCSRGRSTTNRQLLSSPTPTVCSWCHLASKRRSPWRSSPLIISAAISRLRSWAFRPRQARGRARSLL